MSEPSRPKEEKPPDVPVYFGARDSSYWYKVGGRFLNLGAKDMRMHFRPLGLRDDLYVGKTGIREIDYPLYDAQVRRVVDYAGPLAGHRIGVHRNSSGTAFLVTQEPPDLWADLPKKVKAPRFMLAFIRELLPDDQSDYFFHWLKIALVSLRRGDFRPGQVFALAGESGCGKSLLQSIVTEVLGGRQANPFAYMMGEKFNYDLAGAEHWRVEDPASTTDIRARRYFGDKLKEATVNSEISINQKGKDALLLTIFRRVTISINDEPENIAVIPPMVSGITDKIFLCKCTPVKKAFEPFTSNGEVDRQCVWQTIAGEVGAFRAWLLADKGLGELPLTLRNPRFGITAWQHPALLGSLADLSPESRLLSLLDDVLFEEDDAGKIGPFEGKAVEIERKLREGKFSFEADKLLKFNGACGTYLSRLAKQHPERISKRLKDGFSVWTITKPAVVSSRPVFAWCAGRTCGGVATCAS